MLNYFDISELHNFFRWIQEQKWIRKIVKKDIKKCQLDNNHFIVDLGWDYDYMTVFHVVTPKTIEFLYIFSVYDNTSNSYIY